ncbi:hypothetical protein [uncultured Algibacter sp.]|uniref:hypothetical protein n=1 Tax=uncultured Algibacter sp. TaxID=298659 RepID=UPI002602CC0C|nr:hypothetical protein [uncultured Algibacter sp.]
MSILFITTFLINPSVKAQNSNRLFNKHHKWGAVTQYNIFDSANISPNNNPNVNYEIFKSKLFALGIVYNFYQYNNWNFNAELQLQWFGDMESITILEAENITSFNYVDLSNTEHDKTGYLPLTAEYIFYETGSFSFGIGAGVGLTYYWHYDISGSSSLTINDVTLFEAFEIDDYQLFYLSNHLQASVYFKREKFMLKASVVYKKSHTSFREGYYEFKNLELSPDFQGIFDQSGDFLGFSLSIYPKKYFNK